MMHFQFEQVTSYGRPASWGLLSCGLTLMAAGILVIIFPRILALIVGGILLVGGTTLIGVGWQLRRLSRLARPTIWTDDRYQ